MKNLTTTPLALIVGGSSGMGKATAHKLLTRGIETILIAENPTKLAKTQAELSSFGTVQAVSINLYDSHAVSQLINQIEEQTRHIKYLVNSAGYYRPISFLEHNQTDYDKFLDLNKSFFFITQAVAKNMKAHNGGAIVNVGSIWAKQAIKATPSSAYSMQKAGLHSLTQHLAIELADYNIRVNAIATGVVETDIFKKFVAPDQLSQVLESFHQFHPLGRNGQPEEIGDVIDFLLSDNASWVTGAIWDIDGGVMAGRN